MVFAVRCRWLEPSMRHVMSVLWAASLSAGSLLAANPVVTLPPPCLSCVSRDGCWQQRSRGAEPRNRYVRDAREGFVPRYPSE